MKYLKFFILLSCIVIIWLCTKVQVLGPKRLYLKVHIAGSTVLKCLVFQMSSQMSVSVREAVTLVIEGTWIQV